MSSYPKTVLLISHDRYFLDRVTTKTLEIEHAKATFIQVLTRIISRKKRGTAKYSRSILITNKRKSSVLSSILNSSAGGAENATS